MSDLIPTNLVVNDPVDPPKPVSLLSPPKLPRHTLKLSPFPSYPPATQFGMTPSPTSVRRPSLTPEQAFHHASGSFFAPEPNVREDWIYRSTSIIPEASYSGSSSGSNPSPDLAAVITPATVSNSPGAAPSGSATPAYPRPRAHSHHLFSSTGVHYSSAHRRVPSSPSFRAPTLPYFDRPPSPTSSISSRYSEPPIGGSLSLSELLAENARMVVRGPSYAPEDEHARREEQREGRRLAMLERHTAVIEQREKRRWSKTARAGCIEWVENNSKKYEWRTDTP